MRKVKHQCLTRITFFWGLLMISPLQAQTCRDAIPATTPSSDFVVHDNGTLTHTPTGLMWKVCSEGQDWQSGSCLGTVFTYTWQDALGIPPSLNSSGGFAGYTDWRLPNVKELQSIVEFKCVWPAINLDRFDNTPRFGYYWSTSPNASDSSRAWAVYFDSGLDSSLSRDRTHRVRLVRSGQ